MMGPEGVTTLLIQHLSRGLPRAMQRVRASVGISENRLPPFKQITGWIPFENVLGTMPCVSINVEDTTGRLDTRRTVDGAEGDLYIRVYRVEAKIWVAGPTPVDTKQAMHRYALAVREGFQLFRVVDGAPKGDALEVTTRQTRETYSDPTEQSGRFVSSASFLFFVRAEEFVAAPQELVPGMTPVVGSVNVNTGGAQAGTGLDHIRVEGGIGSVSPLIDRIAPPG